MVNSLFLSKNSKNNFVSIYILAKMKGVIGWVGRVRQKTLYIRADHPV